MNSHYCSECESGQTLAPNIHSGIRMGDAPCDTCTPPQLAFAQLTSSSNATVQHNNNHYAHACSSGQQRAGNAFRCTLAITAVYYKKFSALRAGLFIFLSMCQMQANVAQRKTQLPLETPSGIHSRTLLARAFTASVLQWPPPSLYRDRSLSAHRHNCEGF